MSEQLTDIRFPTNTSSYFGTSPYMSFYLSATASVVNGTGQYTGITVRGHLGTNNQHGANPGYEEPHYPYKITIGLTVGGQYKEVTAAKTSWKSSNDVTWTLGTISNISLATFFIDEQDGKGKLPCSFKVRRHSSTEGSEYDITRTYTANIPMEIEALDMGAPTITGAPYYGVLGSNANITLTPGTAGRNVNGTNYFPTSWKWQTCDVGGTIWSTSETASTSDAYFSIDPSYIVN